MNYNKYDISLLQTYIEKGLIEKTNHPSLPLSIYNYSRQCQFEKTWDDITLNCRGLILDDDGNIIARSFPKFFNYEELSDIPNEDFDIFEKMDGSLIMVFDYWGEILVASKGSFISDQAKAARGLIYNKYGASGMNSEATYLFEFTAPWNRIVVDYGNEEQLTLLGAIRNEDGTEAPRWHLEYVAKINNIPLVKKYDGINDFKELKNIVKNNQEGFVIRFSSGKRMKIKGEEYVRLHRLLTNFSNVDIWECLKNGDNINQFLERVPDEFDEWVKRKVHELRYHHYSLYNQCGKIYDYFRYGKYGDVYPEPSKKEFVEFIQKSQPKGLHAVFFAMWDGNSKKVDDIIWKLIRPTYEKPFWQKKDEGQN